MFFKNIFYKSSDNFGVKIFCAKNNDKIIGCLIALVYKDTVYDYYAGSYKEFYDKYPNDLIPWEVFKWGKANNYEQFDFGGAETPKPYGVRDYKKICGTFVEYGRFEKIHMPILYFFLKAIFKLWQKFR